MNEYGDGRDDHAELVGRLGRLGAALELDDEGLADHVLAEISTVAPRRRRTGWLVAAVLVAVTIGVVATPGPRRAVARWFGLDGLTIDVDPEAAVSPSVPPAAFDPPGPGETVVLDVAGRRIVVSAVRGALTEQLIVKTVGSSEQIEEVTVGGHPGLWFAGLPHEVLYDGPAADVVVERVAANTLIWQDGDTLFRIEGFDRLTEAIEFVEGT